MLHTSARPSKKPREISRKRRLDCIDASAQAHRRDGPARALAGLRVGERRRVGAGPRGARDHARQRRPAPARARIRRHRRRRLDGERHACASRRARRARRSARCARSRRAPRWRCPTTPSRSARTRSSSCTPSRAPARRSWPPRWPARSVGPPEQAAATTVPITEAAGRAAHRRQRARGVRRGHVADDALERRAHAPPAAGRRPATSRCRAAVTLVQQLQLALLPDGSAVLALPRPGACGRRRAAAVRRRALGRGRLGGARAARSGSRRGVRRPRPGGRRRRQWPTRSGASPTAACAPRRLRAGGAFGAAQTVATSGRTPRVAGASGPTGPSGGGVLLAWLDISGQPVLRTAEWTPSGVATAASTPLPSAATTLESLALAADDGRLGDRDRDDGHGRRTALRRGRARAAGDGDAVDGAERAHRPDRAGRLAAARDGLPGRAGAVGRGQRDRRLGHRPRPAAHRRAGQAHEDRHRRARGRSRCAPATPGRRSSTSRGATATARPSTGRRVRHAYARAGAFHGTVVVVRCRRQHGAAHVRGLDVADRARAVRRGATPRGLKVFVACMPSSPSVTGTRDGRHCRARRRCRSAAPCRAGAAPLVPGKARRGQRVVVRVTGRRPRGPPARLRGHAARRARGSSRDHTPSVERISVSVPASSANLGPGYDCLGVALPLRNVLEVERRAGPLEVSVSGEGADTLPADADEPRRALVRAGLGRAARRPRVPDAATPCRCRRERARRARRSWPDSPRRSRFGACRTAATS